MKKVILVSGHMRSGKNQFADYLLNELRKTPLKIFTDSFAAGVKDGCKTDFNELANILNNLAEKLSAVVFQFVNLKSNISMYLDQVEKTIDELKIKPENWYEEKTPITRALLQAYGTEIFRKRVDNNWWANQLLKRIQNSTNDVVIITDVRFPNEIEVFLNDKNIELYTIRIERDINIKGNIATHDSETSLDDWSSWNYIINNNGSLDELQGAAKEISKDILITKKDDIKEFPIVLNKVI